ncbi:tetratricopeptide repeat protein [Stutzerimonas frequens]|uniref:tetratricopeptide repeat protein n=1 Tax=Stutzerimonas frequens TaxID=2968969 RepID=UPI0012E13D7E|nr:tetratricopeptide repeat protein [Stutzerimonas frequens]MUT70444.1 tetratricopeptide repeat protein [Stutzerimonas frequens]
MSLVNDMLRDLEARGAASGGQGPLIGMQAVDEAAALRRQRSARIRRWLVLAAVVVVLAAGAGLAVKRGAAVPERAEAPAAVPASTSVEVVRLLDVLPHQEPGRFVLQLLLDRPVSYQRTDEGGAVSLRLSGAALAGEARSGRFEQDGLSLSWRVEARGDEVRVLLFGLTERLDIRDRLEPAGGHAQLWLEVKRQANEPAVTSEALELPVAEAADVQADLPDWVTRTVPEAVTDEVVPPARQPTETTAEPVPEPEIAAQASVRIGSHRPDPLLEAQLALRQQNYPRAVELLQSLHEAQPDNPEATRWLARAYLAGDQLEALLAWLPGQLRARPEDSELRMLLGRAQLLGGDKAAALATLEQNSPAVAANPGYHALLAALRQQVGDWSGSAALYRQLVALQPQQAAWQLGLAIALEQLDQPTQAAERYRLAVPGQGLDGNARRFAAERAAALGDGR